MRARIFRTLDYRPIGLIVYVNVECIMAYIGLILLACIRFHHYRSVINMPNKYIISYINYLIIYRLAISNTYLVIN